ncbi:MAG: transglycosylase domain-containing protein [Clostridia bacterium]|nr:transglycosylase domain-containing protein [Clostridia bacterium]
MNKVKKVLKFFILTVLLIVVGSVTFAFGYYFSVTAGTKLDESKLALANNHSIKIVDTNGNYSTLRFSQNNSISIKSLSKQTIDAFVSVEDKRFYQHHGVDYIRILGAIKNNIFHPSHKQGGSTITQQVIKNTQLSSEKTLTRKLKEIKLAKELENKLSKDQILEVYLNSIYFGNGCYGIENASQFYFGKSASELTISESALLASTINAPSVYDPVSHKETATKRKNLILRLMKDSKKISESEYMQAIKEDPAIVKKNKSDINQYRKGVIAEACKILHVNENQLKNLEVEIETYFNPEIQESVENSLKSADMDFNANKACIVVDNKSKAVVALANNGKADINLIRRQPGSLIKPLLVYAPAFETGKFSPASFVEDSPVNYGGYMPENFDKKYRGEVSVREAIKRSLNVPAVKVFSDVGINYCVGFAKQLGLTFDPKDRNLALALGGFTNGHTLKQLADAYMCLASSGQFCQSQFIKSIKENGKLVYNRQLFLSKAMTEGTAYLITDCLRDVAKSGTAKRLNLEFDVASKTGTVGNKDGNSDAYNVCYTTDYTTLTWIGTDDNSSKLNQNVTGATFPTIINSKIMNSIYREKSPQNFTKPNGIVKVTLSDQALAKHILEEDIFGTQSDIFNRHFTPPKSDNTDTLVIEIENLENSKPTIKFSAKRNCIYQIYRQNNGNLQFLDKILYVSGPVSFVDLSAEENEFYEYFVVESRQEISTESNHIKLIAH